MLTFSDCVHLADNGSGVKSLRFGDSGYGSVIQVMDLCFRGKSEVHCVVKKLKNVCE